MQIIKGKIKDNLFVYNAVDFAEVWYNHAKSKTAQLLCVLESHSFIHSFNWYLYTYYTLEFLLSVGAIAVKIPLLSHITEVACNI